MLAESILDGLNPEQRQAVTTTEGPLLVVAGAGSGKTRVLTSRIAWLIGVCGIPVDSILAVTFTNKAAGEMRERVQKLLGDDAQGLWIGTFHSVCVRILRRDIGHLERSRGFVIYDDADSLGVAKEVLRRHDLDPKRYDPRRLRWRIDQWKNGGLLPAKAIEQAAARGDIDDEQSARLYVTYQRLLADANALDFGDLLVQTVELFRRFPRVLDHYRSRWQYVLVDEYQDTNRVQYDLVNLLAEKHHNICVVGDPDQSIYAWRGADIRNILDFERDYEKAAVVKLERNYRSTQPILSSATAVVKHNQDRKDKEMFTERAEGDPVRLFEAEDDREEAQWVVRQILIANRREQRGYGDAAILYRTNAQSRGFEEELLKYDVPYVVVGGLRFYDRAEIKDAMAYLRLIVNPADDQALRRVVNKPARGIGKKTLDSAAEIAAERELPLMEALELLASSGGRAAGRIAAFGRLLEELRERAHESVDEILIFLLDKSGYVAALNREETPEAESRVENLRELVASAEEFHAANADALEEDRTELEVFLDQVALVSDLDDYERSSGRVSLMTAHSAKGLEFPLVFLAGMEEGIFPHSSSTMDPEGVEEERRLCYVGMTRAMERLHLSYARVRRRFGQRSFQSPSRFLGEVPPELVDGIVSSAFGPSGVASGPSRSGRSLDYSVSQELVSQESPSDDIGVGEGTRVIHPIFGPGTVMAVVGSGLNQKLRIRFERVGIKTVMLKYANLELG